MATKREVTSAAMTLNCTSHVSKKSISSSSLMMASVTLIIEVNDTHSSMPLNTAVWLLSAGLVSTPTAIVAFVSYP